MPRNSLNDDGLVIAARDLSAVNPGVDDDGRLYQHDGSSGIELTNSEVTSQPGYYRWDNANGAWDPMKSTTTSPTPIGVVDVQNHGDPSDADTAFENALAEAGPGDTLLFRDATFTFTADEHIIEKSVNLKFENAEIQDDRGTVSTTGQALFDYRGGGKQTEVGISTAVSRGDKTIDVADASAFSTGDLIYLEDTSPVVSEFVVVESVNTTDHILTLEGTTRRSFSTNGTASTVDMLPHVTIEGGERFGAPEQGQLFSLGWCLKPEVRGHTSHAFGRHVVTFANCYKPRGVDLEARNAQATGSGQGEAFYAIYSTDVSWDNPTVISCRRGVDAAAGCTGVTVTDPTIKDYYIAGISTHGDDAVSDFTIVGGDITTHDRGSGGGIVTGSNCRNVTVVSTSFVAYRRALELGGNATVSGVDIELSGSPAGSPSMVYIRGDDVEVGGKIRFDPYSDYTQAVDFEDSVSNVAVDLDVTFVSYAASGNDSPLFGMADGASNITIEGTVTSLPDFSGPVVRVMGQNSVCENVTANVSIQNHGGIGVQLRGDAGIQDITVAGQSMDTDDYCINVYAYDNVSTCQDLRFRDNDFNNANGVEINVGHDNADRVYLTGNDAGVSLSSGVTNVYRSAKSETNADGNYELTIGDDTYEFVS